MVRAFPPLGLLTPGETIAILAESGESGFRIETLIERTGISKSSLYTAFGSRDGLIAAALAKRFEQMILDTIGPIQSILGTARSRDDLRTGLRASTEFVADLARTPQRVERSAIIAGTKGRPEYSEWLTEAQTRLSSEFADIIAEAQGRGWVSNRFPARLIANYIQASVLGRVIVGFDSGIDPDEHAQWVEMTSDILDRVLFTD